MSFYYSTVASFYHIKRSRARALHCSVPVQSAENRASTDGKKSHDLTNFEINCLRSSLLTFLLNDEQAATLERQLC